MAANCRAPGALTPNTNTADDEAAISGEFIERDGHAARNSAFVELGPARQRILALIADRIRAENASANYREVSALKPREKHSGLRRGKDQLDLFA